MKSIIIGALLSTVAVAQYPPGWIDFRSGTPGKGGAAKSPVAGIPKPGSPTVMGRIIGPYKAKNLGDLGFTGYTIYAPMNPPKGQKLPVLVYSNNGGLAVGRIDEATVAEISSYGYYVIVQGAPDAGFSNGGPPFSNPSDGFDAINWVLDQGKKGKLPDVDATKIFAGGTSMGGLNSYTTSQDKRISGTLIISSGILAGGSLRAKLSVLTKPVGYFEGGSFDAGTANGKADYNSLKIPTTWANGNFGHGQVNPDRAAAIVAWLDWQGKGNQTAGKFFTDPSNGYLKTRKYTEISAKNIK